MAEVGSDSKALIFPKMRKEEEKESPSDAVTPKLYFKEFKRRKQRSLVLSVGKRGGNFQVELTTEKIDSCANFK